MARKFGSYQSAQTRLAVEDSYGTGGTAYKRLNGFGSVPAANITANPFAPPGSLIPTLVNVDDDFSEGSYTGRLDFNGLVFVISSLFGPPTVTNLGGSPVAYLNEWFWDGKTPIFPVSYQCHYGYPDSADQITGMLFNTLQLSGGRENGFDLSGNLLGKKLIPDQAMGGVTKEVQSVSITGTPTGGTFTLTFDGQTTAPIAYNAAASAVQSALEALNNIRVGQVTCAGGPLPASPVSVTFDGIYAGRNVSSLTADSASLTGGTTPTAAVATTTPGADAVTDIKAVPAGAIIGSVYVDSTNWGDIGTSQALYCTNMNYQIGDRYQRVRPINKSLSSDDIVETTDQTHTVALTLARNAFEEALFTQLRGGLQVFSRVEWVSDQMISGGNPFSLQLDQALFLTAVGAPADSQSLYTREWTGRVGFDADSGNALRIGLQCAQNGVA